METTVSWKAITGNKNTKVFRTTSVLLLFSCSILVLALVGYLVFSGNSPQEKKYIEPDKYQAVFLNSGRVYFGHILAMNNKYISLVDIYYLPTTQAVQPKSNQLSTDNLPLIKLGCELHGPEDRMLINRDQITFWENLKVEGQVTQAITAFKQQNPNGQTCPAQQAVLPSGNTTAQ